MSASGQDVGEAAAELTSALVAIDSINPGLVAGAAGESEIVNYLDARLARAGFTTHVVQPRDRVGRPSLVAVGSGRENVPTVVLNGHLDTVGVSGMAAPFEPGSTGTG